MARRELLTEDERVSLFGVPTERAALARHYTLRPDDLDFLSALRGDANRLGAATWMALLRHPGFGLRHDEAPPRELGAYLADQLELSQALFAVYGGRAKTRLEHGWDVAAHLGVRGFEAGDIAFALDRASQAAWSTNQGLPIVQAVVEGLRERGVILPASARIERIGLAGRARARKRALDAAAGAVTAEQATALDALLVPDPATGVTPIAWLRDIADSPSARNLSGLLSRLTYVRQIGLDPAVADTVHERRFRQLVREGAVAPAFLLSDYSVRRRRATLAAQLIELEARLSDAAVQMFDKQVGELFAKARAAQKRHNVASARDVDHVFALCHLLGYRFVPRIRDLADRRLGTFEAASHYKELEPLIGRPINTGIIHECWDGVVRLAASLKAKTVAPSVMLKKLSAYKRQNRLDFALQEIGRIERALLTLDWLESKELRRRCLAGLNKGEARHALAAAVFTQKQGRLTDRTVESQQFRASGLNLVTAAIVYWNTLYIGRAVEHLRAAGHPAPDHLLAHTAPLGWTHIRLTGDYLWREPDAVADVSCPCD